MFLEARYRLALTCCAVLTVATKLYAVMRQDTTTSLFDWRIVLNFAVNIACVASLWLLGNGVKMESIRRAAVVLTT